MEWLNKNSGVLGLFLAAIPLLFSIITAHLFVRTKIVESHQRQFDNFHRLLDLLLSGHAGVTRVHQQMACVFELRKFPQHREVIVRILTSLRSSWAAMGAKDLLDEIDITLGKLRK
jgi:hypothetical protein